MLSPYKSYPKRFILTNQSWQPPEPSSPKEYRHVNPWDAEKAKAAATQIQI